MGGDCIINPLMISPSQNFCRCVPTSTALVSKNTGPIENKGTLAQKLLTSTRGINRTKRKRLV